MQVKFQDFVKDGTLFWNRGNKCLFRPVSNIFFNTSECICEHINGPVLHVVLYTASKESSNKFHVEKM